MTNYWIERIRIRENEWTTLMARMEHVIAKTKTMVRFDRWGYYLNGVHREKEDDYEEIVAYRKKLQDMVNARWEKAWGNKNPYEALIKRNNLT